MFVRRWHTVSSRDVVIGIGVRTFRCNTVRTGTRGLLPTKKRMIERLSRGDDATRMSGAINEAQATNERQLQGLILLGGEREKYRPGLPGKLLPAQDGAKPELIMPSLAQYFEGKIDFEGQKLVERIAHYALIELAIFAFFVGLLFQSIQVTFVLFGFGGVAVLALIIPPWPVFNQNPVVWLPRKETKEKEQ